jgi:hypothetical protein
MSFDELIFSNGRWYTTPCFQAKYETPEHDRTERGVKNLRCTLCKMLEGSRDIGWYFRPVAECST